jgi:hypothetical protein
VNFRVHWKQLQNIDDLDKDAVASFVKTLYSSGLTAARDAALREEHEKLLRALGLGQSVPAKNIVGETRRVANTAVALLRKLQSKGER